VSTDERVLLSGTEPSTGGSRRAIRLAAAEAIAYARAVAPLVPAIERRLDPDVYANRAVGRGSRAWTRLEPWRPARLGFDRAVCRLSGLGDVTLVDVRRCYASIDPAVVEGSLHDLGRNEVAGVLRVLGRLERRGIRGLPIGPHPSAILANAVLGGMDRAIRRAGARHVRWVDDVAIAAPTEAASARAIEAARDALAAIGLVLHDEKSRVLAAESLRRIASASERSHGRR
jgi:hypothetical protein